MGRIAELDLSIKESFVDKLEAICRNRGWDSDSDFEDVVESIYNFGSIGCAEDLIDYAKDVWLASSCDVLARIYNVIVKTYKSACEENGYLCFRC